MSSVQLTLNQVMQLVDSARQIDKADTAIELLRDWAVGAEKEIDRLATEANLLRNERNEALDSAQALEPEIERLRGELSRVKDCLARDCPFAIAGQPCGECEYCNERGALLG